MVTCLQQKAKPKTTWDKMIGLLTAVVLFILTATGISKSNYVKN